jgi:hypothetical protein
MPTYEQIMEALAAEHDEDRKEHEELDRRYERATGRRLSEVDLESMIESQPALKEIETGLRDEAQKLTGQLTRTERHVDIALRAGPVAPKRQAQIAGSTEGRTSTKENPIMHDGRKIPNGMTDSSLRRALRNEQKLQNELEEERGMGSGSPASQEVGKVTLPEKRKAAEEPLGTISTDQYPIFHGNLRVPNGMTISKFRKNLKKEKKASKVTG